MGINYGEDKMKPPVPVERAKMIIQGWYNAYCKVYDRPVLDLRVEEKHEKVSGAYKVTNPKTGASTPIFWSTVSAADRSDVIGIPGDLMGGVWDAFNDLA